MIKSTISATPTSKSFNADAAAAGKSHHDDENDLDVILMWNDKVQSKRERLRVFSLQHRRSSQPTSRSIVSPATTSTTTVDSFSRNQRFIRSSASASSPTAFASEPIATPSIRTQANPASLKDSTMTASNSSPVTGSECQNDQIRRIFKDIMSPHDEEEVLEGGAGADDYENELEFVDENLYLAEAAKKDQTEAKRVRITRNIAMAVPSTTFIVVLTVVLSIRRQAGKQPEVGPLMVAGDNATANGKWSQACFQTNDQLDTAILAYLKDPDSNSIVAQEFGYPIGSWCVSNITIFSHTFSARGKEFSHLYETFNEPLDGWDISSAVSLESMFDGARAFNQDLSMWNVSQVNNYRYCFRNCDSFDQDLSAWDLHSATRTDGMFQNAKNFRGRGLGTWVTRGLRRMDRMFQGASAFSGVGVGRWDISKVISMVDAFRDCASFNEDLHLWRFSHELHDFSALFQGCTSFNGRVDGWNLEETRVSHLERLFHGASIFNQPIDWNVSKIGRFDKVFSGATTFNQDLDWDTTFGFKFDEMFHDADSFNSHSVTNWDMSRAETVAQMFRGATSFNQPLHWNFLVVKDMSFMFADASSFNQDLHWNTDMVENMSGLFSNATKFNGVISWNVSQVQNMDLMFHDAISFDQELPWNLTNARKIGGMFWGASNFNQNLCDWGRTLQLHIPTGELMITIDSAYDDLFSSDHASLPIEHNVFMDSACEYPSTPVFKLGRFIGPFCHNCSTPL